MVIFTAARCHFGGGLKPKNKNNKMFCSACAYVCVLGVITTVMIMLVLLVMS